MSENNTGQLKQRLKEALNSLTINATFKLNTPDWQNQTVPVTFQGAPEELFTFILDEAKAEFPKIKQEHFPPTYNAPSDVYLDYVDKYEVVEWFKKWFGKPKSP